MPSLLPGFEYDIFISYRQKDNKGDRWVSKFVETLKTEIEATCKDDISIYFDENPHDRLQDTHNVDKSLEGKLKCLIFIPILSKTFCDPSSYAWQYEFLAFLRMTEDDRFGQDVRLRSGNVASRILPIRIHDLEQEDVKLFEKVTGSALRAMDFVFKTATGVNRPLKVNEDHPQENLNKTFYGDQINKVANAIDEVIHGLKEKQTSPSGRKLSSDLLTHGIEEDKSKEVSTSAMTIKSNRWLIITFSLLLFIVGVFAIYKVVSSEKQSENVSKLDKSIAVLPFVNDSPDKDNEYFCNGMMEEILNNLQKIKDFRVLSRTSVEKYRGSTKFSVPSIAKELDVNYIVEGSVQKYGNTFRLRVQLIEANNEKHLWGESYEQEINETKDIFKIQSQVAQTIAAELKATITPDEIQLIEKISTTNLTAYDFYQRGSEELWSYYYSNNLKFLQRAKELFDKALKYDSSFARAYAGLAGVYHGEHINESETYLTKNYLDSILILADLALSYDDRLPEGYFYRALYDIENGQTEQAIKEYDKALKYNSNYWEVYFSKASLVCLQNLNHSDFVKGLEYLHKAASLNHGRELSIIMGSLGYAYTFCAGFPEEGKKYFDAAFTLTGDTTKYLMSIGSLEIQYGIFDKGIEKSLKAYSKDSSEWRLSGQYLMHGQNEEALKYFNKYIERLKSLGQTALGNQQWIGYHYVQKGDKENAEHWFNEQKKLSLESIKLGRVYSTSDFFGSSAYYDLAGVYAFKGEKERALEILGMFDRYPVISKVMLDDIKKYNPLFNSIRNDPEFQKIVKSWEAKYQAEHERVRKWLEEQGKL